MLYTKEIMDYIQVNQGKNNTYGNKYSVQVYNGQTLQANITHNERTIVKIEERAKGKLSFFLTKANEDDIISYAEGCELSSEDAVVNIFQTFSKHKDIEDVLIALLELH